MRTRDHASRSAGRPIEGDRGWWRPVLLGALAGGMGWGIRGQYGHETGAMIAGVLVAFVLTLQLAGHLPLLQVARAVAWCAAAIGIGGSMTYGQTIGLTQNAAVIDHHDAYGWGMVGLALKGGIWIGFAGAFLGMGLSRKTYRTPELALLLGALLALFFLGIQALNEPFDPANRVLPRIYFSADWRWEPSADLKPRREVWGGLLLSLIALLSYVGGWRRDGLAGRLGLWGALGGALGFPFGQSLQAYHAWHRADFTTGFWQRWDPVINWWNMMETTFGLVLGAALGLGLWIHRRSIQPKEAAPDATAESRRRAGPGLWEWALALFHGALLLSGEFTDWPILGAYTELGLVMVAVPVLAVNAGRWWPFLLPLPLTLLPIVGKTLRELARQPEPWPLPVACVVFAVIPLAVAAAVAWRCAPVARRGIDVTSTGFSRVGLLVSAWTYFLLNLAFFRFPWPWEAWTTRTPNALIFSLCLAGLTWAAVHRRTPPSPAFSAP